MTQRGDYLSIPPIPLNYEMLCTVVLNRSELLTVYTPDPHAWDAPAPVWALAGPPRSTAGPAPLLLTRDTRALDRRTRSHTRAPESVLSLSDKVSFTEKLYVFG